MLLLTFGFTKPQIKKHKHNDYTTFTIGLLLFKVIWVNKLATNMFMYVSGLVLSDYENVAKYQEYMNENETLRMQLAETEQLLKLSAEKPKRKKKSEE